MQKIINYCGEKFILSGETARAFTDSSNIAHIIRVENTDSYQIEINNENGVYFGMCKKYKFNVCDIFDDMPVVLDEEIKEEKILKYLAEAFNLFSELYKQHPDELNDFADGIHKCQYVIGMRYAREHRPDLFPMKGDN